MKPKEKVAKVGGLGATDTRGGGKKIKISQTLIKVLVRKTKDKDIRGKCGTQK